MKRLVLFALLAVSAFAAKQQVTITSSNKATVTYPASVPFTTIATWHFDMRVMVASGDTSGWSGTNQKCWELGPNFVGYVGSCYTVGGGWSYLIKDWQDGGNPQFGCPTIPFSQDTVIRVQKFATVMTCEAWSAQGTGYAVVTSAVFTPVNGLSGAMTIGDAASTQGAMAFFRGYSGTLPLNSQPPCGNGTGGACAAAGDLWDYEFQGNLNDGSGRSLTLTPTGSFSYTNAPTYAPACILQPPTTLQYSTRIGTPFIPNGAQSFPLDGGNSLTYLSSILTTGSVAGAPQAGSPDGTVTVQFPPGSYTLTGTTTTAPTFTGLAQGSYVLQLACTDSSAQTTPVGMKIGVVASDATGNVIISNPIHADIIGPIGAIYADPWAAAWQQAEVYADRLLQKLAGTSPLGPQYIPYWDQAQAGTIDVTNASPAVLGHSTTFTTTFCQGPTLSAIPKSAAQIAGSWSGAGPTNVWQNTISFNPFVLIFNNTPGTLEGSIGAVTGANEWFYDAGTGILYVFSVGIPSSTYTSPGLSFPTNSTMIDVWNPIGAGYGLPNTVTGRYANYVGYCTDDTHLTLKTPYAADTYILAGSGLQYAYEEQSGSGANGTGGWWNGIATGDYYQALDMVFLKLYYRTGIDDYLVGFRTGVDRWWSFPGINKGLSYQSSSGNTHQLANRSTAPMGFFLRQAECGIETGSTCPNSYGPAYPLWPGITSIVNLYTGQGTPVGSFGLIGPTCFTLSATVKCPQDVRENAWALGTVATDAKYNPSRGGTCNLVAGTIVYNSPGSASQECYDLQAINNSFWSSWTDCQTQSGPGLCQQADNLNSGSSSWGTSTTGTLTVNSNIVTASGANAGMFQTCSPCSSGAPPNPIIFCNNSSAVLPVLQSECDTVWYYGVYNSGTGKINLTDVTGTSPVSYVSGVACNTGASPCTGIRWQTLLPSTAAAIGPAGFYQQPYMMGLQNWAYYRSYLAVKTAFPSLAANIQGYALTNYNYFVANLAPNEGGPWYFITPMCGNGGTTSPAYPILIGNGCDATTLTSREQFEWLNVPYYAWLLNPTHGEIKTESSILIAGIYAQPTERDYNVQSLTPPNILIDLINPGFLYISPAQQKYSGLQGGIGVAWGNIQGMLNAANPGSILNGIQSGGTIASLSGEDVRRFLKRKSLGYRWSSQ